MGVETTLLDPRKADDEETTTTVSAPIGIRSLSLTVIAIVAAVFALQYGKQFFIPLVISVLVSYALDPVVSWCAKRGVPRSLAAAVVLLSVVGSVGARRLWPARGGRDDRAATAGSRAAPARRHPEGPPGQRRWHDRTSAESRGGVVAGRERGRRLDRAAERGAARPDRTACGEGERLPVVELGEHHGVRRPGGVGALPRLLHADVGRSVQAQAGPGDRSDADEEEDDGADPRRDLRADRALPLRAGVHEHPRGRGQLARVPLGGPRAGRRLGDRGGRVQLDPLLRPGRRDGRHRGRCLPAVRHDRRWPRSWRPSHWPSPASKASCSRRG